MCFNGPAIFGTSCPKCGKVHTVAHGCHDYDCDLCADANGRKRASGVLKSFDLFGDCHHGRVILGAPWQLWLIIRNDFRARDAWHAAAVEVTRAWCQDVFNLTDGDDFGYATVRHPTGKKNTWQPHIEIHWPFFSTNFMSKHPDLDAVYDASFKHKFETVTSTGRSVTGEIVSIEHHRKLTPPVVFRPVPLRRHHEVYISPANLDKLKKRWCARLVELFPLQAPDFPSEVNANYQYSKPSEPGEQIHRIQYGWRAFPVISNFEFPEKEISYNQWKGSTRYYGILATRHRGELIKSLTYMRISPHICPTPQCDECGTDLLDYEHWEFLCNSGSPYDPEMEVFNVA